MKKSYGLLGRKLSHSLSPKIHELIFKYTMLEGEYKLYPMEPACIKDFVLSLKSNNISGLNVTIPYKKDVLPLLDYISDEARKIGAVNTIQQTPLGLSGYNTDYFGLLRMLCAAKINAANKKAMVLGSGGSALTVVTFLKDAKCKEITLVSRNKDEAKQKFRNINVIAYNELSKNHNYDMLINTTPVGMYPYINDCPLSEDIIQGFAEVIDLIYNPIETKLLRYARKNHLKYANGLYMLAAQAVKAQEIWNDIEIKDDVIKKIYQDMGGI